MCVFAFVLFCVCWFSMSMNLQRGFSLCARESGIGISDLIYSCAGLRALFQWSRASLCVGSGREKQAGLNLQPLILFINTSAHAYKELALARRSRL